jgi:hypothetical protein
MCLCVRNREGQNKRGLQKMGFQVLLERKQAWWAELSEKWMNIIPNFIWTSLHHPGGEWSGSRSGRFTPRERAPGTQWIGGCVGPRAVLVTNIIILQGISHSRPVPVQNFNLWTYELMNLFRHLVRLRGRGISPIQGLHLHRTTRHKKNADTHPCSERDSNPRSQCSSGRRQ